MPHTTPTQAAAVLTESAETINGEAPNALNILAALIDIYDDAQSAAPEDRCYVPGAWPDVLDMARKLLAAPTPALLGASVGEPSFDAVCDALHIGSAARSLSTVMMNLSNLQRRAECLSAIERMFFTVTEEGDEEDDFEPRDVCLLNWGHDPDDYVKAFGEALATRASSSAQAVEDLTWSDSGYNSERAFDSAGRMFGEYVCRAVDGLYDVYLGKVSAGLYRDKKSAIKFIIDAHRAQIAQAKRETE